MQHQLDANMKDSLYLAEQIAGVLDDEDVECDGIAIMALCIVIAVYSLEYTEDERRKQLRALPKAVSNMIEAFENGELKIVRASQAN